VDVARDLLDKQVVDRNGRMLGRVDGIVLERPENGAPRLTAILIGPVALAFRLHPTLGRWMAALERACGLPSGRPVRIDVAHISDIGRHVHTDLTSSDTPVLAVEQRLRRWVSKIPEIP
jgi:sporulation protein YlmC with PRC-barrel domain